MGLAVAMEERDDLLVVSLSGELDIYTVPGFRRDMGAVDPVSTRIVVDLSDVTLLDSSGLGALLSMLNRSHEGEGDLALVCPHRHLRRVFEVTGLREAFAFGDDIDSAILALDSENPT